MKWLADENLRSSILKGLLQRSPAFDIVRAQDVQGISGREDLVLLGWATLHDRVLLTHDVSTMLPAMREQLRLASRCTPIVLAPDSLPIGTVIEQVLLLDGCSIDADWAAGVVYLPLG